jgi:taurine dioxygenase
MSALKVAPLTKVIGAEVSGIDLAKPLDAETRDRVEALLLEHMVLFFREQDLGPEALVAFAKHFGAISVPPFAPKYGNDPEYIVLDQVSPKGEGADNWHSDNTFMAEPPMGSILKAVELPELGGDTCFANAVAAYEALSPALREMLDGLTAVHDLTKPLTKAIAAGHSNADLATLQAQWPPVEHPVVRTHPRTGKKALYVNGNSTTQILGLTERENDLLLPFLNDHVRSPDFQCRFRWDTRSVAFWDNRSAQHYAVADYDERRIMHRVTLEGDRPR